MEDFALCRRAQALRESAEVSARDRRPACHAVRRIRTRERAQAALSQARLRTVSARMAQPRSARRAPFRHSASARATCSRTSPPTARWTKTCTAAIPISGCGPTGRRPIRTPARPKRSPSAANTGGASCSTSTCSGRSTCSWPAPSNGRATGTFPSASITTWRSPPTASAATCGRTGPSTSPAAASVRRPTISLPRDRTGPFRRPTPLRHREDGYRLFAESIRKNCRHGGALRIDHVMRLFRLYWIPDGVDATEGAYVRERTDDFVRILALESVRNQVVVVGEDLGTVEPAIRETLARFGILSYRLFYFEKNERGEFRSQRRISAAGAGLFHHPRSAHAGRLLGRRRHRRAPRRRHHRRRRCSARSWSSARTEKQKMLDVLFQLEAGARRPAALGAKPIPN